jgi:hypothetical protein
MLLAILCTCTTVLAIEDTPENRAAQAERYLEAAPLQDIYADMAEQMARNVPQDERAQFKAVLTKHLDIPAITKATKEALVKHFTAPELKALADFFGSEMGKSALKKYGAFMAEVTPAMQAEMMEARVKAHQERAERGVEPESRTPPK